MREMRKHVAWYLRGFPAGSEIRSRMSLVSTLDELRDRRVTRHESAVSGHTESPQRAS